MSDSYFDALLARRLRRRHLIASDVVAAVVLALADVLVAGNMLKDRTDFTPAFLGACLGAAGLGAAVAMRRRWPLPALGLALAISVIAIAVGVLWDPFAATALVLYLVAAARPRRCSARALMLCLAAATATGAIVQVLDPQRNVVFAACWIGVAWLLPTAGWLIAGTIRGRRHDAMRLAQQRDQHVLIDERLRIARELHDVVTHGMGLIAVKAGIANHIADARPEEARDALRVIEATSRSALTEMRRLLGVLREDTDHQSVLAPPGIAGLPELAHRVAIAGVQVELTITDAYDLPETMELTIYRIVQEAVTNVVKHAAPAHCRVNVSADQSEVRIEVTDDGPGLAALPDGADGHGLVGMRERVAMYGGRFTAGAHSDGGFTVTATLPYGSAQRPGGGVV